MSATLSACGRYRYLLTRDVPISLHRVSPALDPERMLFVMLNPSTADATLDDPTIRKCRGFAERAGACAFDVVNLYAWRATDPDDLRRASERSDIIGAENDAHIALAASRADLIVAAWGALNLGRLARPAVDRAHETLRRLRDAAPGRPIRCLGTTQNGQPRHPLMLAYATAMQEVP